MWNSCRVLPTWDDRQFLAVPAIEISRTGHDENLKCWELAAITGELQALGQTKPEKKIRGDLPKVAGKPGQPPAQWTKNQNYTPAAILAGNAAVAVKGTPGQAKRGEVTPITYSLMALSRDAGQPLWEVPLSCEPIPDGLKCGA